VRRALPFASGSEQGKMSDPGAAQPTPGTPKSAREGPSLEEPEGSDPSLEARAGGAVRSGEIVKADQEASEAGESDQYSNDGYEDDFDD